MSSTPPFPIRILIADDHPVTLEGLVSLFGRRAGFSVVARAGNGAEAVARFCQHQPDVALLDTQMPQMGGREALTAIRREFPQARIVMMSSFETQDGIYRALQAGALSYLLKDAEPAELFKAIEEAATGRIYLPPHITTLIAQRMRAKELTTREIEVLGCVAQGMSNQEIAGKLFVAEGTVKVHVSNLLNKMGVSDRTQAVTCALKRGLVTLD